MGSRGRVVLDALLHVYFYYFSPHRYTVYVESVEAHHYRLCVSRDFRKYLLNLTSYLVILEFSRMPGLLLGQVLEARAVFQSECFGHLPK